MPVTVTISALNKRLLAQTERVNNPDLAKYLGGKMSQDLIDAFGASGLISRSGATVRGLQYVSEPEYTNFGWTVTVGNPDAFGERTQPAPRGTLRAFYNYLEGNLESTGPVIRYTQWRQIPNQFKDLLEQGRRAGLFGGRGKDYANYMWVQNYGNAKANISGRGFIESGVNLFRSKAGGYIKEWRDKNRA